MKRHLRALLGLILFASYCQSSASVDAFASGDAPRPLFDYTVTPFGPREGAPSQVMGIAQTPDGFLWLASSQGLIRFDGVRFVPEPQVTAYVSAVAADRDGAVWMGFEFGGIGRLKNGHYEDMSEGYARHTTWMIVPDDAGDIWTVTSAGIYRRSSGRWEHVGPDQGLPADAMPRHVGKLDDGSIWIAGPEGSNRAWLRGPHETRFTATDARALWWPLFGIHEKDVSPAVAATLDNILGSILVSFDTVRPGETWHVANALGRLGWSATRGQRVFRDDAFAFGDAGNGLTSVQHDREGNIWLGDTDGIVRISPARLHAVAPRKALLAPALARSPGGDVWVGANGGRGIYHATSDSLDLWRDQAVSVVGFVADPDALWIFNGGDMALSGTGAVEHVTLDGASIPGPPAPKLSRPVHVVIRDPRGGILAATPVGFVRYADGAWSQSPGIDGLPASGPLRLAAGPHEQLWLGYPDGTIARADRSGLRTFVPRESGLGAIYAIAPGDARTWIGGDAGIGLVLGDRVVRLANEADSPFAGVRGLLETSSGELWINAARGVYRISKQGVDDLLRGMSPRGDAVTRFDEGDGLQGGIVAINSAVTLVEGAGGKIWMSRIDGANWFDPANAIRNRTPAQPFIESVSADGQPLPAAGSVVIPPGAHRLEFAFTSPSLTRPDKVTFRYRLEGKDATWSAAGTRRFAAYADLDPGTYRFEVRAFNEDGLGAASPASIELTVEPTLVQTGWFRAGCAIAIVGALLALYSLRIRRLRERMRVRLEARHEERDRIARELHDTLLQSMQGLAWKVHAWSDADERDPVEQRKEMRRVADAARHAVVESRTRILELRTPLLRSGLLDAILEATTGLAAVLPQNFDVSETGRIRPLAQDALDDVLGIAEEAMRNAGQHASARTITVSIHHGLGELIVSVSDDGTGIPAHVIDAGRVAGHWGLVGMHERAARLHASLQVANPADGGARVRLVVPARYAYGIGVLRSLVGRRIR